MLKPLLLLLSSLLVCSQTFAGDLLIYRADAMSWPFTASIEIGVQTPDEGVEVKGDVLYLPDYGDAFLNHRPLFDEWSRQGLRVITFDYPSHGGTEGASLNWFTFERLAKLAKFVERDTRQEKSRPLILSGLGLGGLLATRMIQGSSMPCCDRPAAGVILFAPAIASRIFAGTRSSSFPLGEITLADLTNDPNFQLQSEIKPLSPGSKLLFTATTKINSIFARLQTYPKKIPTLVIVGSELNDSFVNSAKIKAWVRRQQKGGAQVTLQSYQNAFHQIDNERANRGGTGSRELAAVFARDRVSLCAEFLATPQKGGIDFWTAVQKVGQRKD
jgi:alpha-beta hydrolase superfamily lysophospholipase